MRLTGRGRAAAGLLGSLCPNLPVACSSIWHTPHMVPACKEVPQGHLSRDTRGNTQHRGKSWHKEGENVTARTKRELGRSPDIWVTHSGISSTEQVKAMAHSSHKEAGYRQARLTTNLKKKTNQKTKHHHHPPNATQPVTKVFVRRRIQYRK